MKEVIEEYGMVVVYSATLAILTKSIPILIDTFEAVNRMFIISVGG